MPDEQPIKHEQSRSRRRPLSMFDIVGLLLGTSNLLPRGVRNAFVFSFLVYAVGFLGAVAAFSGVLGLEKPEMVGGPSAVLGVAGLVASVGMLQASRRLADAEKVEAAEERARGNPERNQYAWEVARLKLESYLDRNLRQVSSIFYLCVFVMAVGMGLIGIGIWQAIADPTKEILPILSSASGIIVQIIGGTLLLIYRSTMDQAENYVVVLERINAVGMSINIIESIEGADVAGRDKARAELARDLLGMYSRSQG